MSDDNESAYENGYRHAIAECEQTLHERNIMFNTKIEELNLKIKEQKNEIYNLRIENATTSRSISKSTK